MAQKRNPMLRYVALAVLFCAVCLVYVGRLFYVQLIDRVEEQDDNTTVRFVYVPAVRGVIYDRNGKELVTNRYAYDLVLSQAALSAASKSEQNKVCMALLEALRMCEAESAHTEKYFPFDGSYPNYTYSAAAEDENTAVNFRLRRILKSRGMKEDVKAADLLSELIDGYYLLERDRDGNRVYTDSRIDRLLRLRYDMDANRFGEGEDYTFASDAPTALITYVQELSLTGVSFTVTADRVYCYPGYASHILGSVGPIYAEEWEYYNERGYQMNAMIGKSGCEAAFEAYLHGTDGKLRVTFDENGTVIATETVIAPQSGQDVYLTIDIDLQIAAEDALAENVQQVQGSDRSAAQSTGYVCNAGAAVAMDPTTFEILAVASYPTYDLSTYNRDYNDLVAADGSPLVNRALRGVYAPGSTFKVLMAAAGLTDGLITSSTRVTCPGRYTVPGWDGYSWGCSTYPHSAYGTSLTVTQALADSCNSFFYDLGLHMGIDRMAEYMKLFGIGEESGIELGELTGTRSEDLGGAGGNLLSAAIGQYNTQLTPLQIGVMTSTAVNGGTRYAAHLLREVRTFGSDTPSYTDASVTDKPLSQVGLSDSTVSTVLRGMRMVVSGSAQITRNYRNAGVDIATVGGKTGTAEVKRVKRDPDTGEEITDEEGNRRYVTATNALYAGTYTPAGSDRPELVISVVLENASHGYYASYTAAKITAAYQHLRHGE